MKHTLLLFISLAALQQFSLAQYEYGGSKLAEADTMSCLEKEANYVANTFFGSNEVHREEFLQELNIQELPKSRGSMSDGSLVSVMWRKNEKVYWVLADVNSGSDCCNSSWNILDHSKSVEPFRRKFDRSQNFPITCTQLEAYFRQLGIGIKIGKPFDRRN